MMKKIRILTKKKKNFFLKLIASGNNLIPDLRKLGDMEIHVPAEYEWQEEEECGCMVVLRYWQLFHNAQHNKLRGKAARVQVLKY